MAIQYAAIGRRPAVIADFGVLQEPQQLFQTTHLVEHDGHVITETRESAFIRGIETKNCVVIMDELTRVENERCLNPLMPLLDGRKSTWIDELRRRIQAKKDIDAGRDPAQAAIERELQRIAGRMADTLPDSAWPATILHGLLIPLTRAARTDRCAIDFLGDLNESSRALRSARSGNT